MNTNIENQNHPDLDGPLEAAVWAVLSEPLPGDAILRVKQRAQGAVQGESETIANPIDAKNHLHKLPASRLRLLRFGAPLAIAASLMMVASFTFFGSSVSLAQVIEATLSKQWVHSVSTWYGQENASAPRNTNAGYATNNIDSESWYCQDLGIFVAKLPGKIHFVDRGADLSVSYNMGSDTVKKTLPTPLEMIPIETSGNLLEQLNSIAANEKTQRYQLTEMITEKATVDGRAVTKATCDLAERGNPLSKRSCVFVIDRESKLLRALTETFANGLRRETVFDYPETGPSDMVQAGIPASVAVVDRRASTDVRTLEAKWTAARVNFDDYDAIVVQVPEGLKHSLTTRLNTDIKRVRRSGNRYRVDMLLSLKQPIEPPARDADLSQWWKQHRDQYWSVPMLICDGQTVTYYEMVDGRLRKDEKPNLDVTLRNEHPVHGVGSDRPVAWPHLMPEYAARPHLSLSDPTRRFTYSVAPDDGPEDTVRLVVTKPDATTVEVHRYWLDPEVGLGVRRMVQPVFHSKASSAEKVGQVAYVDTEDLMEYEQSPSGYWFPTKAQRVTSESRRKQLRSFHVDFDVNFDNALFQPLDLTKYPRSRID